MKIRRWLQHLKNLHHRVRAFYLNAVFRANLCSRRLTTPTSLAQSDTSEQGADLLLPAEERTLRVCCSEAVTVTPAYQDWIAPLRQLPANATPTEIKSVIAQMLNDHFPDGTEGKAEDGTERVPFPLQDYTHALPAALRQATEFVQFGHVTKQPALNLVNALVTKDAPPPNTESPAIILIHGQSLRVSK